MEWLTNVHNADIEATMGQLTREWEGRVIEVGLPKATASESRGRLTRIGMVGLYLVEPGRRREKTGPVSNTKS